MNVTNFWGFWPEGNTASTKIPHLSLDEAILIEVLRIWSGMDAQSLAWIDQELGAVDLTPAHYDVIRRIIYYTADFSFASLVEFSPQALAAGAAAIATRAPVIVDVTMVQVALQAPLQNTFLNLLYSCQEAAPLSHGNQAATIGDASLEVGLLNLIRHSSSAIVVIGQSAALLGSLTKLVHVGKVRPALVVATPPLLGDNESILTTAKAVFQETGVSWIGLKGRKGGAAVAVGIVESLIDLTWQAYNLE